MACLTFDKRRKRWRVFWQVYKGGTKIFHGSKVFLEKSSAITFYARMEDLEKSYRSGNTVSPQAVHQCKDLFFQYIRRHSPRTQEGYRRTVNDFVSGLKVFMIEQVEKNHIRDYLDKLKDKNLSARTINNSLIALKSFMRFCSEQFKITNPAALVHLLKEEPPFQRFLTESEYQATLKVASQLAADRLRFIACTGLRAEEFSKMTSDCRRESTLTITGKGRKRRHIPLNKTCLEVLSRYPDLSKFTVTRSVFYRQCRRIAKKAKIEPFGPHSLRHLFATALLLKGIPIKKVSILLGHQSVQTTERTYAHILPADLKGVTDCLA